MKGTPESALTLRLVGDQQNLRALDPCGDDPLFAAFGGRSYDCRQLRNDRGRRFHGGREAQIGYNIR